MSVNKLTWCREITFLNNIFFIIVWNCRDYSIWEKFLSAYNTYQKIILPKEHWIVNYKIVWKIFNFSVILLLLFITCENRTLSNDFILYYLALSTFFSLRLCFLWKFIYQKWLCSVQFIVNIICYHPPKYNTGHIFKYDIKYLIYFQNCSSCIFYTHKTHHETSSCNRTFMCHFLF